MKTTKLILILSLSLSTSHILADGSMQNASAASKHSVLAVANGVVFTSKVVSGVVAVPLIIIGNVGKASDAAGDVLLENATEYTPLTITEITITADQSPSDVMGVNKKEK